MLTEILSAVGILVIILLLINVVFTIYLAFRVRTAIDDEFNQAVDNSASSEATEPLTMRPRGYKKKRW